MKNFFFSLLWLVTAIAPRAAEYIHNGVFANFATPTAGSYYTTSTNVGLWQINVDGGAGYIHPSSAFGHKDPWPTNKIDVVSPTASIAPSGGNVATNSLIDLCGDFGPGTLWQTRANLVVGTPYKLILVTQGVPLGSGLGVAVTLRSSTSGSEGDSAMWVDSIGAGNPISVMTHDADITPSYTYGAGHPATNAPAITYTTNSFAWRTNTYNFTATSTGWILRMCGVGTHKAALLRSVSITEQ